MQLSWSDPVLRSIVWQVLIVGIIAAIFWYLASNTMRNLASRHIATGFAFLGRVAGIPIAETLIPYDPAVSTFGLALLEGLLNTLKVAVIGVILATILGTLIGIGRLSTNFLVARLTAIYVEVIRDIPLLLQLFFWYALVQGLPAPRNSLKIGSSIFLSNRGFKVPLLDWQDAHWWALAAFVLGLIGTIAWNRRATLKQEQTGIKPLVWPAALLMLVGLPVLVWAALGAPFTLEYPVLRGFNFVGGGTFSPEFGALLIGLVIYTASYIAEICTLRHPGGGTGTVGGRGGTRLAARFRVAADRPAASDAGDHPADGQSVPEPHKEQFARGGDRLSGLVFRGWDDPQSDWPGDRGNCHHHGCLPEHQPVDQHVHELV